MSYEPTPPPAPEYTPPPPEPPAPEIITPPSMAGPDRKGAAIAALVLGILSLASFCLVFCAAPLGLAGVITGVVGLKSSRRGMAMAGLILSILGIGVSVLLFILGVALFPWSQVQNYVPYIPTELIP